MDDWVSYIVACIAMGLGIGFDVMVATVGRFRHFHTFSAGAKWIERLTATHIVFPMVGYYGFTTLDRTFPEYKVVLGFIAAFFIAWFLWNFVRGWTAGGDHSGPPSSKVATASWTAVLTVSWDALWSGPAKSAQALHWSFWEVAASFVIAGFTVTIMATVALIIAVRLKKGAGKSIAEKKLERIARWEFLGIFSEFCVIGYFGVLAIDRYVIGSNSSVFVVFGAILTVAAVVFYKLRRPIYAGVHEALEAESACHQDA